MDGASIARFMAVLKGVVTDPEGFNPESVKELVPWDELEERKRQN